MKKGDCATFYLKKLLRKEDSLKDCKHSAMLLHFDEKKECIFFLLKSGKLTELSLDAIYECHIETEKGRLDCTGRIKERFRSDLGKIFKFEIENGFYKINLK